MSEWLTSSLCTDEVPDSILTSWICIFFYNFKSTQGLMLMLSIVQKRENVTLSQADRIISQKYFGETYKRYTRMRVCMSVFIQ